MNDNQTIITPYDSPFYQPDWRYRAATALATDAGHKQLPPVVKRDDAVRDLIPHIRASFTAGARPRGRHSAYDRVSAWAAKGANEHVGHVMEALLLTEAPLEALAADLGCDLADLRLYERVYFNVRSTDGPLMLGPAQKAFFATEGTFKPTTTRPEYLAWRRVAVSAGYKALIQILELGEGSWMAAPEVDLAEVTVAMTRAETVAKIAAGGLSTGELARLESNRIKDRVAKHMTGELKTQRDPGMELALQLLQKFAPTMVEPDRIRRAQAMAAVERQQQADATINATAIPDTGPESTQALIDAQLQPMRDHFDQMYERHKAVLPGLQQ